MTEVMPVGLLIVMNGGEVLLYEDFEGNWRLPWENMTPDIPMSQDMANIASKFLRVPVRPDEVKWTSTVQRSGGLYAYYFVHTYLSRLQFAPLPDRTDYRKWKYFHFSELPYDRMLRSHIVAIKLALTGQNYECIVD